MKIKNKTLKLTLICFAVWFIDYLTTVVGVGFLGLLEGNPIMNSLYSVGLIGWIIVPVFSFCFLFLAIFVGEKINNRIIKKFCRYKYGIPFFVTVGFVILEIVTIINNVYFIIKYG